MAVKTGDKDEKVFEWRKNCNVMFLWTNFWQITKLKPTKSEFEPKSSCAIAFKQPLAAEKTHKYSQISRAGRKKIKRFISGTTFIRSYLCRGLVNTCSGAWIISFSKKHYLLQNLQRKTHRLLIKVRETKNTNKKNKVSSVVFAVCAQTGEPPSSPSSPPTFTFPTTLYYCLILYVQDIRVEVQDDKELSGGQISSHTVWKYTPH